MPEYSYYSQIFGAMLPCELRISETFYGSGELFLFTFFPTFKVRTLHAHRFQRNQSINQSIYYFADNQCRIKVGVIDAAASGPFKK